MKERLLAGHTVICCQCVLHMLQSNASWASGPEHHPLAATAQQVCLMGSSLLFRICSTFDRVLIGFTWQAHHEQMQAHPWVPILHCSSCYMPVVLNTAVCVDKPTPVANGTWPDSCNRTQVGGTCTAECDFGYRSAGSPNVTCQAGET
jgi:hypothetical protein